MENNNLPLVSVCVTTYQHAPYIKECLDSILMQKTDFPFEIILGEDESTDGTREICIEYAEKHPDIIRLFLRSRKDVIYINGNPTGRFNFTKNLKAAKGKYVALCEGDDYWTDPLKLQKQVDFLDGNEDCVACHHWHQYAWPDKNGTYLLKGAPIENQGYLPKPKSNVIEIFGNRMRVKSRTIMFRNTLELPDWFYKVSFGDVVISMLLGQKGLFGFIDEPIAVYRQTRNGVSSHDKGNYLRLYQHNMNWIEIWEYGIHHFKYKYWQEAKQTILSFYKKIVDNYKGQRKILFKVVKYSILRSKLSMKKRIEVVVILLRYIMIRVKLRTKMKVKKVLIGHA